MTKEAIRNTVLRLLGEIAPETDLTKIRPEIGFRDQLDLDSMDVLNFAIALHKEFGIEIPEADYSKLDSLETCISYLAARQPSPKKVAGG